MATTKFKNKVKIEAELEISQQTASRALVTNASKEIISSSVTSTELGYVSGVTGAIQTQLNDKIDESREGVANGIATLDAGGKIPVAQLPSAVMTYEGTWNATTNSPTLIDGTGDAGMVYRVSVAGSQDLGSGSQTFVIGDWVVYNGTIWQQTANGDNYNNEMAQDAVGSILTDTASIDFTYNDGTPSISAVVLPAGVDHDALNNFVANEHIDHSAVNITTASNSGLSGGGNITASRSLVVDINGTTVETAADNADEILIWDVSANARRKMTRANFLGGSIPQDTDDLPEGATNLYFTNERVDDRVAALLTEGAGIDLTYNDGANTLTIASTITQYTDEMAQDAVGAALTDTSSIDFTYNDGANTISAVVLPAGVDHDALSNFVANEHVDHSAVSIATASGTSGLSGGGDITTTRNLVVDITGTTALGAAPAAADEFMLWDASASALKKVTYTELTSGFSSGSAGDIEETSFASANNQASPANVTGFAFANAVVRSFKALVSVEIDATADLFESFELLGIQKGSSWDMAITATGDDSGITFTITNAGQVQYTSTNVAGFSSGAIKFRAITTSF